MKEDIALQLICRNILERHNEAPSGEELDAFLEAGIADLLSAFSDGLMHNWHTWKKERKEGGQKGGQEGGHQKQVTDDAAPKDVAASNDTSAPADVALKNDITSDAGWANSEDEEIMAGFLETEEAGASPQDNSNKEKDAANADLPADLSTDLEEDEEESEEVNKEKSNPAEPVAAESDNVDPPAPKDAEAQPPTADPDLHLPSQNPTMNREPYSSTVLLKIPNAMVNTAYSEQLTVASGEVMRITTVEGLEDTGLCYDDETQSVQGNPTNPGEFKLTVTYTVQSGGSGQGQLNFVVNHDPKSLWKDIPSDEAVKFWKKDEDSQEQDGRDGWKLVGASKRGRSHAHEGKCRDDDFVLIGEHPEQWHILAVADGAGSSQYSREGARIAVNTSADFLAAKLTEHDDALVKAVTAWDEEKSDRTDADLRQVLYAVFSQVIYKAINTIHLTSKKEQCKFRDFYATLLIAVHKQIQGRHFVAGYWIGDGGMAVYKEGEDGYIKLLGEPDSGEYAGQTRFLDPEANDGEDIMRRISFDYLDSMTALFLLTDGITDPIFETDHNLGQPACWDAFWAEKIRKSISDIPGETEKNLMDWLSFWSPGNHDDRTIALLARYN